MPALNLTADEARKLQAAREEKIREDWIRVMEMRIVREKLNECWRTEGVNAYEQCAHLAQRMLEMIPDARIKGFRTIRPKEQQ
jgi:hypothetical protein